DGQDGWEKAQAFQPDLVITDLMMPRMHGYEFCEHLKGPEGIKGVRIIVASSKPFATDKAQAEAVGADAYLVKPYTPAALLGKVRELLSQAPSESPPPANETAPAPAPAAGQAQEALPVTRGQLPLYVHFWGTRGSCPAPGAATTRYGGNTACTEVRVGETLIILDCGSGMRELGSALLREYGERPITGHIFVGHTHWDHIQGFPFFAPLYNPRNSFTLYSVHGAHGSLESVFRGSMASDYFPIPLKNLACKLRFTEMTGPVDLGSAQVSFAHLNHPGICIGFRIDAQGRSVTYLSDHERFARLNGEDDNSRRNDARMTEFARGSDLLIREAQYTQEEYSARRGWGHSTFDDAVLEALNAGAKKLAIFHHDPDHTDDMMDGYIRYCRGLAQKAAGGTDCFAARDGLRIEL
ncbi:MAG: hypothetical protein COT18_00395, partial [Elusimicrobia bacterium CG08_land_8_20_14_0_20_59_10]